MYARCVMKVRIGLNFKNVDFSAYKHFLLRVAKIGFSQKES